MLYVVADRLIICGMHVYIIVVRVRVRQTDRPGRAFVLLSWCQRARCNRGSVPTCTAHGSTPRVLGSLARSPRRPPFRSP